MDNSKRINTSIKLYPIFYSLTADFVFLVPVYSLFFTLAKGLNASQISAMTTIGLIVCIISKRLVLNIIKKIGNVNSIRLGTFLFLIAAINLLYAKSFLFIVLFQIMYEFGFMFWNMANVLLKNDLTFLGKDEKYFFIRNKAKTMYGITTMITTLIAGILFNINRYIPIYISIVMYFVLFLLSFKFYEAETEIEVEKEEKDNSKIQVGSLMFLILLSNAIFYGIIKLGQENSKLFMQYDFQKVLSIEMVTYYITTIVFISRIVRIAGNVIFSKVYLKIKDKISIVLSIFECLAFLLLVIGHFIDFNFTLKVVIMALGFFCILAIRDSFQVYIEDVALNLSNKKEQQGIMVNIENYRKIVQLILSTTITLVLMKYELVVVEIILFILSICEICINRRMIKKLSNCIN